MNINVIVPHIIAKIDHNCRYFVVNVISPDFLMLHSLNTRRALNRKSVKLIKNNGIQISGGVMSVYVEGIVALRIMRIRSLHKIDGHSYEKDVRFGLS